MDNDGKARHSKQVHSTHMSGTVTKSALPQMCSLYKFIKYITSHITLTFWIATNTASKELSIKADISMRHIHMSMAY
jgi:hypothetical protein